MNTRILLIDNYDSFTYILRQRLTEAGASFVEIAKNDNTHIPELAAGFDSIVFSPGPGTPENGHVMFNILEKFYTSKRVLGICLGHQAICTFFGATLINLQYPMHGKKTKLKIYKSKKNIFSGIQDKIITGRYHSWVVSEKNFPDCLEITSVSGEGHIMSVAHKNYNITGIQFHPESYMTNTSLQILKNWINME